MSGFAFKAIGLLIVVGGIFFAGVFVGGGFATEAAETTQRDEIAHCLPVETVEDLDACLSAGGDQP